MPKENSLEKLREAWEAVADIGSISKAARVLGISRTSLQWQVHTAMKKLKLPFPEARTKTAFSVGKRPEKERSLDELKAHRRAESVRTKAWEDAGALIRIQVATPGPIGLMVFGDPHIDNPGCDFELLERHLQAAAERRSYVLAGNIGDLRDNWIGRLERLYADTTVSAKETWKLVEWMLRGAGVNWTWLIKGNHDLWAGNNDPLDWIVRDGGVGLTEAHGARLAFVHPNGSETRVHARHDFPGNSIYNPLHALKRETLHGHRDHVIVAGHRHIGADAGDVNGEGHAFQMVRVSGYKTSDAYRHQIGAHAKPIHPAALIVLDPDAPEGSRDRAWCAPSIESGMEFLDWKRGRYERGRQTQAEGRTGARRSRGR